MFRDGVNSAVVAAGRCSVGVDVVAAVFLVGVVGVVGVKVVLSVVLIP